ncbi:MAG: translation elongation factor Ts [Acidobacteriia bacterium]|nr:translation elongation factor Ts [Terriglobia bacterium]MYG02464.1 translation elongation factor Ts [Terriglobia bacterium]MYK11836.1 translation elongation factor Ts [Terriglobia bacterium]
MAEVSAKLVKELRDKSGAGFMECKKALVDAGGDLAAAEIALRKRGVAIAQKKSGRAANEGVVGSYIHAGAKLGVLVEVNCESDFVARTDDFQQLVKDIAMQIAAADPKYITREQVPAETVDKERQIQRDRALQEGKAAAVVDRIVDGRMGKFYEEIVLVDQPFVKDPSTTIGSLLQTNIAKLGENMAIRRFQRFKVGEDS